MYNMTKCIVSCKITKNYVMAYEMVMVRLHHLCFKRANLNIRAKRITYAIVLEISTIDVKIK